MAARMTEGRYFETSNNQDLWQRYCGFLDLDVRAFMEIQEYLLLEQIEAIADTPLGKAMLGGRKPSSLAEFRRTVPIRDYSTFAPYIGEQQVGALGESPYFWCHSAGRGGNFKWVPYTQAAFDKVAKYAVAAAILSSANQRGEVRLSPGAKVLVNLAPRPYASGSLFYHFASYFPFVSIPPFSEAEEPDFKKRTETAFKMALERGIDYIFCLSPVLVKIGESFSEEQRKMSFSWDMVSPGILYRYASAWLRSRFTGRRMMPRDLWKPKGLITFGVDTPVYQEEITRLWGCVPYQFYGTTETMVGAMQSWNKKGLTFLPDMALWEFIPEEEWRKEAEHPGYQPRTVLLDELEAGKQYELVLTHFYGMPLMRYRIGDVIKVLALNDAETGAKLPQVVFQARANEIIDLAGLTQIDERTMLQTIVDSGVRFEDWTAKKEYDSETGYLRLLIELKEPVDARALEQTLEERLQAVDVDYRDLEGWLGQRRAVRVTVLQLGSFRRFYEEKVREGVPLARLKPSRINPSTEDVEKLLRLSTEVLSVP